MNVLLHFQKMDQSLALKNYILKKFEKLKKFVKESAELELYFNFENRVFSPALVISANGKREVFRAKSDNAYKAVNMVYNKAKNKFSHNK